MKDCFAARLLIALSLTTTLPAAMANQDSQPQEPNHELVLPDQTEPQAEPESKPAMPVAGSRGQMLYENHCQECHTSIAHVRETHRARSLQDLKEWVTRWAGELKLSWSADDIDDVVEYLNQRYYKFE